ncbi:MAG: Rubrerythrin [Deltaproteobacteria bacterium]|nr:Rubrerythrin [Deltaproteobacteria bacterium]
MPEFVNPFSGKVSKTPLTLEELTRALRLNIAAEEEAVHLYQAHADATDHPLAKKVLLDIADEERVHIGEFQRLLNILLPDEETLLAKGAEEVDELAGELKGEPAEAELELPAEEIPTVGSLKEE